MWRALAGLPISYHHVQAPRLVSIELASNQLHLEGAVAVAKAVAASSATIELLDLSGNYLTPEGVEQVHDVMVWAQVLQAWPAAPAPLPLQDTGCGCG